MLLVMVYPWHSMKYLPHITSRMASSTLFSSAIVELLVFNFFPREKLIAAPYPRLIIMPM